MQAASFLGDQPADFAELPVAVLVGIEESLRYQLSSCWSYIQVAAARLTAQNDPTGPLLENMMAKDGLDKRSANAVRDVTVVLKPTALERVLRLPALGQMTWLSIRHALLTQASSKVLALEDAAARVSKYALGRGDDAVEDEGSHVTNWGSVYVKKMCTLSLRRSQDTATCR